MGATDNSVATKQYVDDQITNIGGGTKLYAHRIIARRSYTEPYDTIILNLVTTTNEVIDTGIKLYDLLASNTIINSHSCTSSQGSGEGIFMGFSGDAIHLMLVNGTTVTAVSQYARGDW
jgi:hypothetical protein